MEGYARYLEEFKVELYAMVAARDSHAQVLSAEFEKQTKLEFENLSRMDLELQSELEMFRKHGRLA